MRIEEPKPKAAAPVPEAKTAISAPPVQKAHAVNGPAPPEKSSVSTGDKWVRPSSVNRDRLRTGERHAEKTELEKAREAFAVADKADVDTRMLRASEVRELMARASAAPEAPAAPAPRIPQSAEPTRPSQAMTARPIEQTAPASGQQPERAKSVGSGIIAASRPPLGVPAAPGPVIRMSEPSQDESEPEGPSTPAFRTAPEAMPKAPPVVAAAIAPAQRPVIPVPPSEAIFPPSKYSDDGRIREIESDILHFSQQLRQLEFEMETTRSSLDGEVERYRAAAEARRTRAENLEGDLRRAKAEWSDADKDFRKVKSRRDKEVEDAQRRIEDQAKRIKNAESTKEKRIREIEKEKQA